MQGAKEESLVLPAYRCANKPSFLCDLIAFVFFIKGQCPSFTEVEAEVKLLLPSADRPNKLARAKPKANGLSVASTTRTPLKSCQRQNTAASPSAKMFTCYASPIDSKHSLTGTNLNPRPQTMGTSSASVFTCYTSPVECKLRAANGNVKAPLLALSEQPLCGFMHAKDELHVSFLNEGQDAFEVDFSFEVDISRTFDNLLTSAKSFSIQCAPRTPIMHIKRNVHQERMLRCLSEVVPAVLLAAPNCDAIMLAFGQNLFALEHAVMLEFAPADNAEVGNKDDDNANEEDDEQEEEEDDSDDDEASSAGAAAVRQRQKVFSRLLGVSGLADALPLTSMHVLLRSSRAPAAAAAAAPPPPPPFRPRPQFRLRPSCRLTRLTLPCPAKSAVAAGAAGGNSTDDSLWFHSATPVPGYALPDRA